MKKMVLTVRRLLAPALLCLLLSGCYEDTKQEVTLNPDGSGKVIFEATFIPASEALVFDGRSEEPSIKEAVHDILTKSDGVEAWRDVSFRALQDGSFFFRGTAYFADLSKLELYQFGVLRFEVMTDGRGGLILATAPRKIHHNMHFLGVRIPDLHQAPTRESLQLARTRFRASKPILLAMVGTVKQEITFHLPGTVREQSSFEKLAEDTVRVRFDGQQVAQRLEQLMADDNVFQSLMTNSAFRKDWTEGVVFNERLFGHRDSFKAVIRPISKPLFDYRAEVGTAVKEYPALAKQLGFHLEPDTKPGSPPQPLAAEVTGIEWTFGPGREPEYVLKLQARLPAPVHDTVNLDLDAADTVEGLNLVPKPTWPRFYASPYLAKDKTTMTFSVRLLPPPIDSRGIARVAGKVECQLADPIEWIELMDGELVVGAKGTNGLMIHEIQRPFGQREKIVLQWDKEIWPWRSVRIDAGGGHMVELKHEARMAMNGQYFRTMVVSGGLPKRGKLQGEIHKTVPRVTFPFIVSDLTLLGRPRK